jgi:hypothetical protein
MSGKPNWPRLAFDSWVVSIDAAAVMGLRIMKLAACDTAAALEAQRMVSEKVEAALALQALVVGGALGNSPASMMAGSLRHYGRTVRANRRRLGHR